MPDPFDQFPDAPQAFDAFPDAPSVATTPQAPAGPQMAQQPPAPVGSYLPGSYARARQFAGVDQPSITPTGNALAMPGVQPFEPPRNLTTVNDQGAFETPAGNGYSTDQIEQATRQAQAQSFHNVSQWFNRNTGVQQALNEGDPAALGRQRGAAEGDPFPMEDLQRLPPDAANGFYRAYVQNFRQPGMQAAANVRPPESFTNAGANLAARAGASLAGLGVPIAKVKKELIQGVSDIGGPDFTGYGNRQYDEAQAVADRAAGVQQDVAETQPNSAAGEFLTQAGDLGVKMGAGAAAGAITGNPQLGARVFQGMFAADAAGQSYQQSRAAGVPEDQAIQDSIFSGAKAAIIASLPMHIPALARENMATQMAGAYAAGAAINSGDAAVDETWHRVLQGEKVPGDALARVGEAMLVGGVTAGAMHGAMGVGGRATSGAGEEVTPSTDIRSKTQVAPRGAIENRDVEGDRARPQNLTYPTGPVPVADVVRPGSLTGGPGEPSGYSGGLPPDPFAQGQPGPRRLGTLSGAGEYVDPTTGRRTYRMPPSEPTEQGQPGRETPDAQFPRDVASPAGGPGGPAGDALQAPEAGSRVPAGGVPDDQRPAAGGAAATGRGTEATRGGAGAGDGGAGVGGAGEPALDRSRVVDANDVLQRFLDNAGGGRVTRKERDYVFSANYTREAVDKIVGARGATDFLRDAGLIDRTESGNYQLRAEAFPGHAPGRSLSEPADAGRVNRKPLYEMSPEELDQQHDLERRHEAGTLERVFGPEQGKRYRSLERVANSATADHGRSTAAYDEMQRMEAGLSNEQRDELFGMGRHERPGSTEVAEMRRALGQVDDTDESSLGRSLGVAITEIGDATDPAKMTGTQQRAYAQIRLAHEIIGQRGMDEAKVMRAAIARASQRFGDPEDAAFMLRRWLRPRDESVPSAGEAGSKRIGSAQQPRPELPQPEQGQQRGAEQALADQGGVDLAHGEGSVAPEGQFDADAFDRREAEIAKRVADSRRRRTFEHLDRAPWGVEYLRGKEVTSLRDGSHGTITTVGSDQTAHVNWADEASSKANSGSPTTVTAGRGKRAKTKTVYEGVIFPGERGEFVVAPPQKVYEKHPELEGAAAERSLFKKSAPAESGGNGRPAPGEPFNINPSDLGGTLQSSPTKAVYRGGDVTPATAGDAATSLSATDRLKSALHYAADDAKRYAGKMFPTVSRLAPESGDAAARYVSSKTYAKEAAPLVAQEILGSAVKRTTGRKVVNPELDKLVGAALVQDNLDTIKKERRAAGEDVSGVASLIGAEGSPFATRTDFATALMKPEVKAAIDRYRAWFEKEAEPNFKVSQGIAESEDLPTRGEATGARVNLKAVLEGDKPTATTVYTAGKGNLGNAKLKPSPFARKAKGTGQAYEISLAAMIENTMARGTEIANLHRVYDQLVKDGIAAVGTGNARPTLGGKSTIPLEIESARKYVTTREKPGEEPVTKAFSQPAKKLYIRSDAYGEVRRAVNVDAKLDLPALKALGDAANTGALASLSEAMFHTANQLSALVRTPGTGFVLPQMAKKAAALWQGDPAARARLVELARIGALKESRPAPTTTLGKINPLHWTGMLIDKTDRVGRLMMDDAFTSMAKKGLVKDSEGNRRDFINQFGQYNARAQHVLIALARDSRLGPFATAGSNFWALGLKNLALSPGAKATTPAAAVALRAMVLGRFAVPLAMVAAANYLRWGRMDGSANVPVGSLRLADDEKTGKVRYFDVLSLLGVTRGLRSSGLLAAVEGMRRGEGAAEIVDKGRREVIGSAFGPMAGPAVRLGWIAATGSDPSGYQVAKTAEEGHSQTLENLKGAARSFNPLVDAAMGGSRADNQLGRFAVKTGSKPDQTQAEMLADRLSQDRLKGLNLPPSQQEHHKAREALIDALRHAKGDGERSTILDDAVKNKTILPGQRREVQDEARRGYLENKIHRMEADDAMAVWERATPAERERLRPLMYQKIMRAQKKTGAERQAMRERINAG